MAGPSPALPRETIVMPIERQSIHTLSLEQPPATITPAPQRRRIWKFWGTALWGLFIAAAMLAGQIAVIVYVIMQQEGQFDTAAAAKLIGSGLTLSISVITGLVAV